MHQPDQLPLFDLEPPPEAFCPDCGAKLKKLANGRRVHRRGDGRLCQEIFGTRLVAFMNRNRPERSCLPCLPSPTVKQRDEEEPHPLDRPAA